VKKIFLVELCWRLSIHQTSHVFELYGSQLWFVIILSSIFVFVTTMLSTYRLFHFFLHFLHLSVSSPSNSTLIAFLRSKTKTSWITSTSPLLPYICHVAIWTPNTAQTTTNKLLPLKNLSFTSRSSRKISNVGNSKFERIIKKRSYVSMDLHRFIYLLFGLLTPTLYSLTEFRLVLP